MTKDPKIHPVLLSGGSGTRLWPLSRQLYPKQLLPLTSPQTLLQQTAERFTGDGFAPPVIIGNVAHRFLIAEQMRETGLVPSRIILEPVGRNTAPAAIIAALIIADDAPDDLLLLAPSDHMVDDPSALRNALGAAVMDAVDGALLVFGVVPDNPQTGYGYIKASGQALPGGSLPVERFVEKPDKSTAQQYVDEGNYLWNAGMFLYRADTLIEEMARLDPAMVDACRRSIKEAETDLDFLRLDPDAFAEINEQSLDYALMEKTHRAAVRPIDVGWSDIGSWQALWNISDKDDGGNVVTGDVVAVDVADSYVHSAGPLVAAVGVRNLVVVATPDAVLVVPRIRSEDVRFAVERLASDGRSERELHVEVHRPWGSFRGLYSAPGYQVKRLVVKPGAAISLQYHNRRAEHWVVVNGQAGIRCGGEKMQLVANQSTYIPVGTKHQLENSGDEPLVVIEIQTGDYLGEDDIVRLEDRYGRG